MKNTIKISFSILYLLTVIQFIKSLEIQLPTTQTKFGNMFQYTDGIWFYNFQFNNRLLTDNHCEDFDFSQMSFIQDQFLVLNNGYIYNDYFQIYGAEICVALSERIHFGQNADFWNYGNDPDAICIDYPDEMKQFWITDFYSQNIEESYSWTQGYDLSLGTYDFFDSLNGFYTMSNVSRTLDDSRYQRCFDDEQVFELINQKITKVEESYSIDLTVEFMQDQRDCIAGFSNKYQGDGLYKECYCDNYYHCTANYPRLIIKYNYCLIEGCGNGCREPGEVCDDGNVQSGDGCSSTCEIEQYFSCSGGGIQDNDICTAICGDGYRVQGYEGCDDGNLIDGDGCSSVCQIENYFMCLQDAEGRDECFGICGDGFRRGSNEECDDQNWNDGDGCTSQCKLEFGFICEGYDPDYCKAICGDTYTLGQEECDDGNTEELDGCNSECQTEFGWSCLNTRYSGSLCTRISAYYFAWIVFLVVLLVLPYFFIIKKLQMPKNVKRFNKTHFPFKTQKLDIRRTDAQTAQRFQLQVQQRDQISQIRNLENKFQNICIVCLDDYRTHRNRKYFDCKKHQGHQFGCVDGWKNLGKVSVNNKNIICPYYCVYE